MNHFTSTTNNYNISAKKTTSKILLYTGEVGCYLFEVWRESERTSSMLRAARGSPGGERSLAGDVVGEGRLVIPLAGRLPPPSTAWESGHWPWQNYPEHRPRPLAPSTSANINQTNQHQTPIIPANQPTTFNSQHHTAIVPRQYVTCYHGNKQTVFINTCFFMNTPCLVNKYYIY